MFDSDDSDELETTTIHKFWQLFKLKNKREINKNVFLMRDHTIMKYVEFFKFQNHVVRVYVAFCKL